MNRLFVVVLRRFSILVRVGPARVVVQQINIFGGEHIFENPVFFFAFLFFSCQEKNDKDPALALRPCQQLSTHRTVTGNLLNDMWSAHTHKNGAELANPPPGQGLVLLNSFFGVRFSSLLLLSAHMETAIQSD